MAQDQGIESLKQTGLAFRSVAKKVSPAVVFIKVEKEVSSAIGSILPVTTEVMNTEEAVKKGALAFFGEK